jgi:hypothetical protein
VLECLPSLNMQIRTSHSTLNLGLTVERLLEELEDLYPNFTPQPDNSIEHIMYRAGQRSVVDYIKSKLEEDD